MPKLIPRDAHALLLFSNISCVVPREFASDEPLLGHPETCCVWVTCSCNSARTTSRVFGHLRRKARWRHNFFVLARPKDLLFKVERHVHQIVKFGRIIEKLFCLIEAGPRKKGELVQVHFQHRQAKDCFLLRQQNFSAALRIFIPKAQSQEIIDRFGSYACVCSHLVKYNIRFFHKIQ